MSLGLVVLAAGGLFGVLLALLVLFGLRRGRGDDGGGAR
jgi:hypothetical protein